MKSSSPKRVADPAGDATIKTLFIRGGVRVWACKWGGGITAADGFLLTSGEPIPTLLGWTGDWEIARRFLRSEAGWDDVVDLRGHGASAPRKIGENLLFPVRKSDGVYDRSDPNLAAGHFITHPISGAITGFVALNAAGLAAALRLEADALDKQRSAA